jgi:hypothetical protein
MKFFLIFLNAFFVSFASSEPSIGWYTGSVWKKGGAILGSSLKNGGLWIISKNWNTGSQWNINAIWGSVILGSSYGSGSLCVTYNMLSNMSNWNSLPKTFNVTYSNITNSITWNAYKSTFGKTYANNQSQELIR